MATPAQTEIQAQPQAQVQPQTQHEKPLNHNNGPIDHDDLEDWKARFNGVLAKPGDHVNSKSPAGAQNWFAGFFDCFNPIETCLITYCLPCVTFGKTHHRVRKNGNLEGWEPINTSCLLFCGSTCFGLHWIPMSMQRANIREKYNLEGSCAVDIATSCCLGCCSLVQQDKEAEYREQQLRGTGIQQQYQSNPTEMTYPQK